MFRHAARVIARYTLWMVQVFLTFSCGVSNWRENEGDSGIAKTVKKPINCARNKLFFHRRIRLARDSEVAASRCRIFSSSGLGGSACQKLSRQ